MKTNPHPRVGCAMFRASGHSMTETLLAMSFAALTLAAIPAIGEYGIKGMQTASAAKLLAWQRTVWMPGTDAIDAEEAKGASGAIKKSDDEVTRDLRRHIFRDRTTPGISIHAPEIAEFEPTLPPIDPNTVSVSASTTAAPLPSLLSASDMLWDKIRTVQDKLGSNVLTGSLGKFTFVSGGYLRNEVNVTQTNTHFKLVPQIALSEQVTMLTEAWNAGGTNREDKKIQGLMPMKLLDGIYYQQLRSGLHQTSYTINQAFPSFPTSNLNFGFLPGDQTEKSPLDRFERMPDAGAADGETGGEGDAVGASTKNRFRYYRSFPPPRVVNTLP
ncbi:hypothetical protein J2W30_001406 [Variovorax boronicumulans]|uniref:hypothetical protein n=1 Tax=Variovorax TaxID=34072 RepID=UPI00278B17E5|nr:MULTISPECIES: hypothetical protein [Variovorax]MDQ0033659.1 hypothetical protein [Variovorax boronicumulans]MDQ0606337.1 hypothetical protein [Variovorax sp. W1I1]